MPYTDSKTRWFLPLLLLLAMMFVTSRPTPAQDEAGWGHRATLAEMKAPPTLDGKLEPGEWDNATGTVNFMNTFGKLTADFHGMHMDLREGRTLVGYYGNTLYIAVVSALPPRGIYGPGKHSQEMARDAELIGDFNAIEIWLDPNRDRRESREGDQAFYQVFINSVGSIYDAKLIPGSAPDKGWNTDIQSAHHIDEENKIWTAEIAIDMSNFPGWEKSALDKSMGMLIARNYKALWNQATWFPHGAAFVSWQLYPQVFFRKDAIVARIDDLGEEFWDARPNFDVKLFNPGSVRKARVNLFIESSTMPEVIDEQVIEIPANGSADYRFGLKGERLHDHADHKFNLKVTPEGSDEATFNYTGMWSRNPRAAIGSGAAARDLRRGDHFPFEQKWTFRAEASPERALNISAFPYYGILRITLDASALVADPAAADKDKLSDSAVVTVKRGETVLLEKELSWDLGDNKYGLTHEFKLADLPEGEYVASAKFNRHPDPVIKTYYREVYEWEHNTIGITDKIYPPFEAVRAANDSVGIVAREYGIGEMGLWNSVRSLDREILAGPVVLKADRERILTGKAKLTESTPMLARHEAQASDEAVTITAITTTEIDGCVKLELTLAPGTKQKELQHLALEIPLKEEHARLFHAVTTAIRINPMSETPTGQGVVWDSNRFPNGDWHGNFVPYIWLGGVERGICVFANNDRGWELSYNDRKEFVPCQEIVRDGDKVILRLNLIQKPLSITEPRKITLGLMASPGKTIPYKDWRAISGWHGVRLGEGFEWMPLHSFDMGMAVETVFAAAYPYNRDYSAYDAIMMIPGTQGGDLIREKGYDAFMKDWRVRNGLDKPDEELTQGQRYAIQRMRRPSGCPEKGGPKHYFSMYWDEYHHDYHGHPETKVFSGEWDGSNMARSRQDFRLWYGAETVKRGIGLYFDNSFPHRTYNLITSDAYELPGLGIQPSAQLWEQREYHRRLWNIHREFGDRWDNHALKMIHMTNTNVIPFLTWSDSTLDLEWFYGPEPQQSKYGLPMMQASVCARQTGCIPMALAVIERTSSAQELRIAERTKFGTMMVHEVRFSLSGEEIPRLARILHGFGYGSSGVTDKFGGGDTVYNYWQDDYPVKCDKELVKTLLVKCQNELMLLAVSWDQNPTTANFTIDPTALGLKLSAAQDAEGTVAEQLDERSKKVEEFKARVDNVRNELEKAKQQLEANPDNANNKHTVARRTNELARAEKSLENAEAIIPFVEAAAKLPITFDAKNNRLSVELDGYGVRLIRLK